MLLVLAVGDHPLRGGLGLPGLRRDRLRLTARHDDETAAWGYLAVAAVGAVACLFLGFMLVARFSRAMGLTHAPEPKPKRDPSCRGAANAPLGERLSVCA